MSFGRRDDALRTIRAWLCLLLCGALTACASFPASGPTAEVIDPGYEKRGFADYEVFDIDPVVLEALKHYRPIGLYSRFGSKQPAPSQMIGIGDQLNISVFEAGAGGSLFSGESTGGGSPSRITPLPPQSVDRDGKISVPYAGRVKAAGRTPDQLSSAIVDVLKAKAIQPQVLVSIGQSGTSQATVVGDATGSGRVPLNLKGDHLLEVIAQAGGIRTQPHETFIRLLRGSNTGMASLRSILANPKENIFIQPGDTIYVFRNTPKFTVLGAVTAQKDYFIDQDRLSLAEAVARSGGLIDIQADSSAVFMFRYESPAVVRAIKPSSKFLNGLAEIPVVYRLSFRRPSDFFYAQQVAVQDGDLLYVANAPAVELAKFVTLARGVVSTVAIAGGATTVAN